MLEDFNPEEHAPETVACSACGEIHAPLPIDEVCPDCGQVHEPLARRSREPLNPFIMEMRIEALADVVDNLISMQVAATLRTLGADVDELSDLVNWVLVELPEGFDWSDARAWAVVLQVIEDVATHRTEQWNEDGACG